MVCVGEYEERVLEYAQIVALEEYVCDARISAGEVVDDLNAHYDIRSATAQEDEHSTHSSSRYRRCRALCALWPTSQRPMERFL